MGLFSGFDLNKTKTGHAGGVYFLEGDHVAKIDALKAFESTQSGPVVAVDFVIVESTNPMHKPGDRVGSVFQLSKQIGQSNLKEFMISASGLSFENPKDESAIEKEDWMKVLSTITAREQPYSGLKICARGIKKTKRNGTGDYVRVIFAPHPETRQALVDGE